MIADSSAVVAALLGEVDGPRYRRAIADAQTCIMSAANFVEAGIVLQARLGIGAAAVRSFVVEQNRIIVQPVDGELAMLALQAFHRFGRGRHPAQLNFGDCFAYALAKQTGMPLLYKGNDFAKTDITAAVLPDL